MFTKCLMLFLQYILHENNFIQQSKRAFGWSATLVAPPLLCLTFSKVLCTFFRIYRKMENIFQIVLSAAPHICQCVYAKSKSASPNYGAIRHSVKNKFFLVEETIFKTLISTIMFIRQSLVVVTLVVFFLFARCTFICVCLIIVWRGHIKIITLAENDEAPHANIYIITTRAQKPSSYLLDIIFIVKVSRILIYIFFLYIILW